jgi:hypothetical protein
MGAASNPEILAPQRGDVEEGQVTQRLPHEIAPAGAHRRRPSRPSEHPGSVEGDRERRKAPRGGDRRAWGRRSRHGRLLRRASKAPLARHLEDCVGETHGPGGGGVSARVPLGVVATSGSEETAGRSRLTSNRRFASGRRPGWLRPREISPSHISANRSSLRPALPPVARRSTGASSCRSMTIAKRFRCRPTSCP